MMTNCVVFKMKRQLFQEGAVLESVHNSFCEQRREKTGLRGFRLGGIAGSSEKLSAGVGGLMKIPLDCTVLVNLKISDVS